VLSTMASRRVVFGFANLGNDLRGCGSRCDRNTFAGVYVPCMFLYSIDGRFISFGILIT
jgi:hypothetical protein